MSERRADAHQSTERWFRHWDRALELRDFKRLAAGADGRPRGRAEIQDHRRAPHTGFDAVDRDPVQSPSGAAKS